MGSWYKELRFFSSAGCTY